MCILPPLLFKRVTSELGQKRHEKGEAVKEYCLVGLLLHFFLTFTFRCALPTMSRYSWLISSRLNTREGRTSQSASRIVRHCFYKEVRGCWSWTSLRNEPTCL